MLARLGVAKRLLPVALVGSAQKCTKDPAYCESFGFVRQANCSKGHSSKEGSGEPSEKETAAQWPEIKRHVQGLRGNLQLCRPAGEPWKSSRAHQYRSCVLQSLEAIAAS